MRGHSGGRRGGDITRLVPGNARVLASSTHRGTDDVNNRRDGQMRRDQGLQHMTSSIFQLGPGPLKNDRERLYRLPRDLQRDRDIAWVARPPRIGNSHRPEKKRYRLPSIRHLGPGGVSLNSDRLFRLAQHVPHWETERPYGVENWAGATTPPEYPVCGGKPVELHGNIFTLFSKFRGLAA